MASDPEKPDTRGRFRFKSEKRKATHDTSRSHTRRHHRSRSRSRSPSRRHHSDSHHRHHDRDRRHRRREERKRRHRTTTSPEEKAEPTVDPRFDTGLDPDAAFRESLFDALADDEGAAYWEGIYGQPIHIYPPPTASNSGDVGPDGELERMTDEEYATYVRARMYEKTHQHVIEERARREEERQRRKQEAEASAQDGERLETEHEAFQARIAESLRRGERRKQARRWAEAWTRYRDAWALVQGFTNNPTSAATASASATATGPASSSLSASAELPEGNKIQDDGDRDRGLPEVLPWPVESGKRRHVNKDNVEAFFRHAPEEAGGLQAILKIERIRWHPDKIQHRFGARLDLDHDTMRVVTAVFQTVDRIWTQLRDAPSK